MGWQRRRAAPLINFVRSLGKATSYLYGSVYSRQMEVTSAGYVEVRCGMPSFFPLLRSIAQGS